MAIFKSAKARRDSNNSAHGVSSSAERARARANQARVKRAAYVQPRLLLAGMALILGGSTWWAAAQTGKPGTASSANEIKTLSLANLPAMVEAYGQRRAAEALAKASKTKTFSTVGNHRYALTEVDITPNTPSDEREPAFSPNGDYIAFASTGADTNGDGFLDSVNANGKYHIWVMQRNGRGAFRVSGFGADANRDQRKPAWSPDGNQLVYVDWFTPTVNQLFVARPFEDGDAGTPGAQPPTEQRTFFGGQKDRPSWNSSGLRIAFSSTVNPVAGGAPVSSSSIFTISPSGSNATAIRITGTAGDVRGTGANDQNPSYSRINQDVIFFSSNTEMVGGTPQTLTNGGRRIWMVNTTTGNLQQVTDPESRTGGDSADVDDLPATSSVSSGFQERLAFQSNSLIDSSDKVRDLNIWSIRVDTAARATLPDPALVVSSYSDNKVKAFDVETGAFIEDLVDANTEADLRNPEGVAYSESSYVGNDSYPDLLVANRERNGGKGEVALFDGVTNLYAGAFAGGTSEDSLTHPSDILVRGEYVYVASGPTGNQSNKSTNKVHRYKFLGTANNVPVTQMAPSIPNGSTTPRNGAEFTDGNGVTNGIEGIVFGPDVNNDFTPDLFACSYSDNKINVYSGVDGTLITGPNSTFPDNGPWRDGFVTESSGGLTAPTGLEIRDNVLYVSSSGTNDVLRFDATTGAPLGSFLANRVPGDLVGPEGLMFGPDGDLYVSGQNAAGANGFLRGRKVNRYDGTTGDNKPAPGRANATFTSSSLDGAGYLTFNPSSFITPPPPVDHLEGIEPEAQVVLETNAISSTDAFANSGLSGSNAAEDRVADREPTFGASNTSNSLIAQLAFSSQRTAAAIPNGDINSPNPNNPVVVNPAPPLGDNDHDIWTTASQDFTPPVLVPQGSGNDLTPFIAPGRQAPFFAPRTPEEGLRTSDGLKVAFVLKEQESGLATVEVQFKNAERPTFSPYVDAVNDGIVARASVEQPPSNAGAARNLSFYDDGPPNPMGGGGHELQAGAVKGDGIYYVSGTITPPTAAGDYYIDVRVMDNANNQFLYDHVWGFSTRSFQKAVTLPDLLVSDYTVGQNFPARLVGNTENWRFQDQTPVESYYLTNPGDHYDESTGQVVPISIRTAFPSVNVWRILCRGAVPAEVYDAFSPTVINTYDPASFANGRPEGFPPTVQGATGTFPARTRPVAVSKTSIIWASPYTGTVFAGPGTLFDSNTQRDLTNFLDKGGRLFVSGRDVIYSLTNQGTLQNQFLKNELQAAWSGEEFPVSQTVQAAEGYFEWSPPVADVSRTLTFPFHEEQVPYDNRANTYIDGAWNQDYFFNTSTSYPYQFDTTTSIGFDFIGAGAGGNGVTVIPAYTADGKTVGQRVERTRSNGLQSRLVFFSFGFEGINSRYYTIDNVVYAANVRRNLGNQILQYFKTGGFSGTVTDASTNLPIPNFILQVEGGGQTYIVVTDANGFYEVTGLPPGGYTIRPGVYGNGNSLNPGWQTTSVLHPYSTGGLISPNQNLRVLPVPQGSLSGRAVYSTGPGSTTHNALENAPILLRSISESSIFPGGGRYAQLTTTDAGGRFSFPNVPPGVPMEVVLNPDTADIPENTGLQTNYSGPNTGYGKRIIPDSLRPETITAPGGDSFFLNDLRSSLTGEPIITSDSQADDGLPIIVPFGVTVTGKVLNSVNGVETPVANSEVTLTKLSDGSFQMTATTNAQGVYTFYDVPRGVAGNYRVTATNGTEVKFREFPIGDVSSVIVPTIYFYKQNVSGEVSITENGADVPAQQATITLTNSATGFSETTQSDENGRYSFGDVPGSATDYVITGSKNGATGSLTITVTDGQAVVVPLLKLKYTGIQGKAWLNTSAPVAGVDIYIVGNAAKQATSDANGNFAIPGAAAGSYQVYGVYKGDRSANTSVSVPAGGAGNVRIDMFLQTIKGKVQVQSNGATTNAAGATVTATDGTITKTATTDAAGDYTIPELPSGTWTITASRSGDTTPAVTQTLTRNGATVTVATLLLKLRKVTGTVTVNGVGTSGATVQLLKNGSDFVPSVTSAANGTFTFTGIAAGTYTLRASKGNSTSPDVQVTFNRDTDPAPVELRLAQVNVSGRVTVNGVPTGGLTVSLSRAGFATVTTTTLADGSYGFGEVGPGTWTVTATTGAGGDSASRSVTVAANTNAVVPDIELFLHTLTGTVTIGNVAASGVTVELVDSTSTVRTSTTTNGSGVYTFSGVPAGNYTVRAKPAGAQKSSGVITVPRSGATTTVPTINFQTISGTITLNGSVIGGATVRLFQNGNIQMSTTSDAAGRYRFIGTFTGAYTVDAAVTSPNASASAAVTPANLSGTTNGTANVNIQTNAATPTPTPTATATPTPTPTPTPDPATEDYQINRLYQISVPYADAEPPASTTTVFKAFGMNPTETVNGNTVTNYTLRKWDALTQTYVNLTQGDDIIRRGEGYFLRPQTRAFSMRKPATDPTRIPTNATTFQITLRKNPSLDPRDPNNGYNLIGFPFDPAKFSKVDWLSASVTMPDGTTYATVTEAFNNNKMSNELTTLSDDGASYVEAPNIQKFKGYYVKTFVDGIVVTLKNPQP